MTTPRDDDALLAEWHRSQPDLPKKSEAAARDNARKAWRFVGEMEEILGVWQAHGSFEDEVFKRWTESSDPRIRKRRFAELAQHLVYARRQYQDQKERQSLLFPTAGEAPHEHKEDA